MSPLERIVGELGGVLYDTVRRALVSGPEHGPGDRSVSLLAADDGRILIHCFSPRDDWRTVRDALAERGLIAHSRSRSPAVARTTMPTAQPAVEDRVTRARGIWRDTRALGGSAAELYLRRRAIKRALPASLRATERATSLDDRKRRPALVASIVDADGEVQGVQVTLLTLYGHDKADVATPRRVIGQLGGGAVRLDKAGSTLIIAEGIETALSASEALGLPAWGALTANNLERFTPPPSVVRLIIANDADPAGETAARNLERRLSRSLSVEFAPPPEEFNDWNGWARGKV